MLRDRILAAVCIAALFALLRRRFRPFHPSRPFTEPPDIDDDVPM